MNLRLLLVLLLVGGGTFGGAQEVTVNLQAPVTPAAPGAEVRVKLIVLNAGPAATMVETPQTLVGILSSDHRTWSVELRARGKTGTRIPAGGFSSRAFAFPLPADARGRLVLDVADP